MASDPCRSTKDQDGPPKKVGHRWKAGQSGNPKGRRPGPLCQALKKGRDLAIKKALPLIEQRLDEGDLDAAKILLAHCLPRLKPMQLPEAIPIEATDNLTAKCLAVMRLAESGSISTDLASDFVAMAATVARVDEVTQLREQVERLTGLLDERPGETE